MIDRAGMRLRAGRANSGKGAARMVTGAIAMILRGTDQSHSSKGFDAMTNCPQY